VSAPAPTFRVRNTLPQDFAGIETLCRAVYPDAPPWNPTQLSSHLRVFPQGQLVAVEDSSRVVGMASSLIVLWDDYEMDTTWKDFTDTGMFTNHDAAYGHTLYGAEIFVDTASRGRGIGKALYQARRDIAQRLGLLRIRAGARLRDYHRYAQQMSAHSYVKRVIQNEIADRTLTFQLRQGFCVLAVVGNYLQHDPESLGYAAVIEWLNPDRLQASDHEQQERHLQALLDAP